METSLLIGIGCFVLALLFMFIGVPIALALGLGAVICFFIYKGNAALIPEVSFTILNNFVLIAVPMYILMGEVIIRSGIFERVYEGTSRLTAWIPGGLLHANIVSCALFAAISGSSPATAATIGAVAIPTLDRRGYETKITLGSIAAGGTLGILIPPSIPLLVYAVLSSSSVAQLFAGGIFPGILLSGVFMLYILVRVVRNAALTPREPFNPRAIPSNFLNLWPIFVIMGVVLGGIFGGLFTPTEAAVIGTTAACVISLAYHRLNWHIFWDSIMATVITSSMLLIIVVGASMVASLSSIVGLPRTLSLYIIGAGLSKWVIIALIYLLYLFLGCFIDGISAMVMTLTTILPVVLNLGFDVIWFGIILVLLNEIGMLTPPMAVNIFVIRAISGRRIEDVYKGAAPFFFVMLVVLFILTVFPSIVTWLPRLIVR